MACDGKSSGDGCSSSGWRFTQSDLLESLAYEFQWQVEGDDWSYEELISLYNAGTNIKIYVNHVITGDGTDWMIQYLGGVKFKHGSLLGNSYELGGVIYLADWWITDPEGPEYVVTHELAHVWDDRTGLDDPLQPATWYGNGVSDGLAQYAGGNPNGLRFINGSSGIPKEHQWSERVRSGYGNHSTADYFAETFSRSIYYPGNVPWIGLVFWIDAIIYLQAQQ